MVNGEDACEIVLTSEEMQNIMFLKMKHCV